MSRESAFLFWLLLSGVAQGQNVVVNPTGNQNIIQPVNTQASANNLSSIRYVSSYNWTQSPSGTITGGIPNTVTLSPCPAGIDVSASSTYPYFVYVATTGTAEAVIVTGGTCIGGGSSGTIVFTPTNSHSAGFTIQSATSGVIEASNDYGFNDQHLMLSPGAANSSGSAITNAYYFYAPAYFKYSDITVDCGHAVLVNDNPTGIFYLSGQIGFVMRDCRVAAAASYAAAAITNTACSSNTSTITTPLHPVAGSYVDIQNTFNKHYWGLHQVATSGLTQWTYTDTNCGGSGTITSQATDGGNAPPAAILIDNNISQTSIENMDIGLPAGLGSNLFNQGLIVLNNQLFRVAGGLGVGDFQCSSSYCGSAVYAPGPSANAAVISLIDVNLPLNCLGNGVTDYSGNTLQITGNSVIEGYNQYAVITGTLRGGFGDTNISGLYTEVGDCTNTMWNMKVQAGVINQGGNIEWTSGEGPAFNLPQFLPGGGSTTYYYWLVAHDSTLGPSQPLFMGTGTTSTSSVTVNWWRIPDLNTTTYDVLRMTDSTTRPYTSLCVGGSTSACGSVATGLAQCTTNLCSFTDNVTSNTASYTVQDYPGYMPALYFWPGSFALSAGGATAFTNFGTTSPGTLTVSSTNGVLSRIASVGGINIPTVFSTDASAYPSIAGVWIKSPAKVSIGIAGASTMTAELIQAGFLSAGQATGFKGILNLQHLGGGAPGLSDEITLLDAGEPRARAIISQRPTIDTNDCGIGWDNTSSGFSSASAQLAFHCGAMVSWYIGKKYDNTAWSERLTASTKIFKVPLQLSSTISQYNGLTTGGTGLAPNLGTPFNSGSLTTNQAAHTIYTTAASGAGSAGNYRICLTLWPTVTGTATAIQGNAIGPTGSGTVTLPVGPALNATSLTNGGGGCAALHVAASSAIRCSTTGYSGTGTYQMSCTVEQLQ